MASSTHDPGVDGVGEGPGVGPRVDCGDGPGVGDGVDGPGVGSGGLTVVDSVGWDVGGYNFKVGAAVGRRVGASILQVPHVAGGVAAASSGGERDFRRFCVSRCWEGYVRLWD